MKEITILDDLILDSPRASKEAKELAIKSKVSRGEMKEGDVIHEISKHIKDRWCARCQVVYRDYSHSSLEKSCCWRKRVNGLIARGVESFVHPEDCTGKELFPFDTRDEIEQGEIRTQQRRDSEDD